MHKTRNGNVTFYHFPLDTEFAACFDFQFHKRQSNEWRKQSADKIERRRKKRNKTALEPNKKSTEDCADNR